MEFERIHFKIYIMLNVGKIKKIMIYKNIFTLMKKVVPNIMAKISMTNIVQVSGLLWTHSIL